MANQITRNRTSQQWNVFIIRLEASLQPNIGFT